MTGAGAWVACSMAVRLALPQPVPEARGRAVALGAGYAHTCALLASGQVRCWGANGQCQLGDASIPRLSAVRGLALGQVHTCVHTGKEVTCWGNNQRAAWQRR